MIGIQGAEPSKLEEVFVLPTSLSSILNIKYKQSMQFSSFSCNYLICLRKRKQEGEEKNRPMPLSCQRGMFVPSPLKKLLKISSAL